MGVSPLRTGAGSRQDRAAEPDAEPGVTGERACASPSSPRRPPRWLPCRPVWRFRGTVLGSLQGSGLSLTAVVTDSLSLRGSGYKGTGHRKSKGKLNEKLTFHPNATDAKIEGSWDWL